MTRARVRGALLTPGVALALLLAPAAAQQQALPFELLLDQDAARAFTAARPDGSSYIPGELLVKFRADVSAVAQTRTLAAVRGGTAARARWLGDVLHVQDVADGDMQAAAEALTRQPEVVWAQPNYIRATEATPNDPSYTRQWHLDQIDAPRAWDINTAAGRSVTVAVIDTGTTGADATFGFTLWTGSRFELVPVAVRANPDIAAARLLPGRDFVFWTGPVIDMAGHGSHVAGTVLQETNNSFGLAGVAHGATLLPLKVCIGYWEIQIVQSAVGTPGFVNPAIRGGCSDSAITQAIRHAADNGAQVINLSVGGPQPSPAVQDAIRYAVQRGTFVAIGVGNSFEFGNPILFPAAYAAEIDGAVAVGAVGRSRRRAGYSSTGSHVELVAPGGDFGDGGADGIVWQVAPSSSDSAPGIVVRPRFDRYAESGRAGTSMASPHVAGVAALLYSHGITQPAVVEAMLKRFAVDLGAPGRDDEHGHGLINARAALRGMGLAR